MVIQEGSNAEEQAVAWIRASHAVATYYYTIWIPIIFSLFSIFLRIQISENNIHFIESWVDQVLCPPIGTWLTFANKMLNIYLV